MMRMARHAIEMKLWTVEDGATLFSCDKIRKFEMRLLSNAIKGRQNDRLQP